MSDQVKKIKGLSVNLKTFHYVLFLERSFFPLILRYYSEKTQLYSYLNSMDKNILKYAGSSVSVQ